MYKMPVIPIRHAEKEEEEEELGGHAISCYLSAVIFSPTLFTTGKFHNCFHHKKTNFSQIDFLLIYFGVAMENIYL